MPAVVSAAGDCCTIAHHRAVVPAAVIPSLAVQQDLYPRLTIGGTCACSLLQQACKQLRPYPTAAVVDVVVVAAILCQSTRSYTPEDLARGCFAMKLRDNLPCGLFSGTVTMKACPVGDSTSGSCSSEPRDRSARWLIYV